MGNRQPLRPHTREPLRQTIHRAFGARDHDLLGPVDGRNRDEASRIERCERLPHPLLARCDREHRPARRQRSHQLPACRDELQAVFQLEHAGHTRRHVLPDAVPHHGRGLDAPAPPQLAQRPLQGEERGLGESRLVQRRALRRLRVQHRQQRLRQQRPEDLVATIERLPEGGLRRVELSSHAHVLRPLAREQEHDLPTVAARSAPADPRQRLAREECAQLRPRIVRRSRHDGQTLVELRPSGVRGEGHVGERQLRMLGELRLVRARQHTQRLLVLRGHAQEVKRPLHPRGQKRGSGGFLEHHVRVCAAEAEGADAGDAPAAGWPWRPHGGDRHRHLSPGDVRARVQEMQVRRNLVVLERKDHLDQARNPGRGLQVSDIGLHRTHEKGPVRRASFSEDRSQGVDLDGITQRGPRAVRLHIGHFGRRNASVRKGLFDDGFLGRAVGHRQSAAPAVLIDRRPPDHGQDPIAVGDGVGDALQDHHAAALAAHVAVGGRVEGLAASVGGHHPRLGEDDVHLGGQGEVHSPGQRHPAFALAKALGGQVHRHQR